ncbi:hypothetical protein JD844_020629, partial [Phrynosoma platyrhinos]
IISLIENNSVVIIHGSTGSGKSTQLPQYVLDHSAQRSTYCNIVVTQPRKIGASSIARWISKQRSWPLGDLVGYQVHERTEEMDFLLLVIRKLLHTNSRFVKEVSVACGIENLAGSRNGGRKELGSELAETSDDCKKVILMSATINCQEFADYFAIPVRNRLYPAYVFEVEGKPHAIEEYYLDDLKSLLSHIRIPSQMIEDPQIYPDMYSVAVTLIHWFDKLEMKENG